MWQKQRKSPPCITLYLINARICFQFIDLATQQTEDGVGHQLASYTEDVKAFRWPHPSLRGLSIVFVDTPGFDDTNKTDVEVLGIIARWLIKM